MKTYLITGVSGYVGQLLAKRLIAEGNKVVGIDLSAPKYESGIKFVSQDITDAAGLEKIFADEKPDAVVHLAFYSAPEKDEQMAYAVNVVGTRRILDATAKFKVKKIVLPSSSAAYGSLPDNPVPLKESSPLRASGDFYYPTHKRQQDEMLQQFIKDNPGIEAVGLRPSAIVGKNINNHNLEIFKLKVLVNPSTMRNMPLQFIHEDDAVDAFYLATTGTATGIFNLGTSKTTTMTEFAKATGKACIHVPFGLLFFFANLAKALKLSPVGGKSLAFAQNPIIVDPGLFEKTFNFKPRYQSLDAIKEYVHST